LASPRQIDPTFISSANTTAVIIRSFPIVETAKAAASPHPAWGRAISKAADVLLSNPYVEVMDNGDVLIVSVSSGQIYQVNGRCEGEDGKPCKGYKFNHGICYHRALKRLATRYAKRAN
jgi:hypothetical protein